jgi:hypothetical protein
MCILTAEFAEAFDKLRLTLSHDSYRDAELTNLSVILCGPQ